ncbi:hypothetical protein D3C71_1239670 [compost metagenome]
MLCQADTRQVDVYATVSLVRPEQFHRQVWLLLVQAAVVVGVDDTDVALTGVDRFQHGGVVGEHVSGQVPDPALEDFLGLPGAVHFDHGRGQGLVVDLLRRAQAQAAFPLLVGQRFVGGQFTRLHPICGVGNGPRPQAQAGPGVGGCPVLQRNIGVDGFRGERLEDAHLLGLPEVAGIDGQQQVGRRIRALGLEPLHQRRFLVGDELHLHAGFRGVGIEDWLDQFVDTRGVDHHFVGGLGGGAADQGQGQCSQ